MLGKELAALYPTIVHLDDTNIRIYLFLQNFNGLIFGHISSDWTGDGFLGPTNAVLAK
jgi:hypothetical protein